MTPYPSGVGYLVALLALLVFWAVYRAFFGSWRVYDVFEGADGRPSTSKFQFWVWTVVVVFSYCALWFTRWLATSSGAFPSIDDIPRNLLIAMGISTVTAVSAKGIISGQVNSGQTVKTVADPTAPQPNPLVADDSGVPDLSKIQLLAWTFIAIGVYIGALTGNISRIESLAGQGNVCAPTQSVPEPCRLPDIDASLMVLMGLGSAAYLGKKLVSAAAPAVTSVTPLQVPYGNWTTDITLKGSSFGDAQGGSQFFFVVGASSAKLSQTLQASSWSDSQITFRLGDTYTDATGQAQNWPPGNVNVGIGVIVNGQTSNTQSLVVIYDNQSITGINPEPPVRNAQVTVQGRGFRDAQSLSRIFLIRGGADLALPNAPTAWNNAAIVFDVPNSLLDSAGTEQLPVNVPLQIGVIVGGQRVVSQQFNLA